jgi:hypothetical protein
LLADIEVHTLSRTAMVFYKYLPFSATELNHNGKRAVKLAIGDSKVINLIVQEEIPGFTRFPATYECVESLAGDIFNLGITKQAALRIVAAPGVSIHLENWPTKSEMKLEIFRVQDPNALPPQATSILSAYYTPPPEINPPRFYLDPTVQLLPTQYPLDYFVLEQKSSTQLVIFHPHSTYRLALDYPSSSKSATNGEDARARFCYQIIPIADQVIFLHYTHDSGPRSIFTVVKTASVKATLSGGPPKIAAFQSADKDSQRFPPFQIYDAPNLLSVSPQGRGIVVKPSWKVAQLTVVPNIIDDHTYAMFRTALSLIPVVGDVVDIVEFILASTTGKDFLGRRVTQEELALLGLGAVLSLIPGCFSVECTDYQNIPGKIKCGKRINRRRQSSKGHAKGAGNPQEGGKRDQKTRETEQGAVKNPSERSGANEEGVPTD